MPKDSVGQLIEVGDILLSASKTGNIKIGRVEKIFPSGHITLKFADRIPALPRYVTSREAGAGFAELVDFLLQP